MDFFMKSRLAAWLFVLLIVLNLASLITIWSMQFRKPIHRESPGNDRSENVQRFLNRELSLTNEQKRRFKEAREQYQEPKEIMWNSN